ncbi:hypothetical protein MIMGU_mgv1a020211mg, partial [Erythranthe guttata]
MAFHLRNSRKSPLSASTQVHKFLAGDGGRPSLFAAELHSLVHGQDTPLRWRGVQREQVDVSSLAIDVNSVHTDSEFESDIKNESVSAEFEADLKEVERVCKVIDEMFALDRNMEAVLDECGINLNRKLVLCVLQRFNHARKPAFRFFRWAGDRPGFSHDSTTYNAMMNILGKTRQFETLVSLLEEMGEKGLLTMETFIICIKVFAAAKERKKGVAIVDLMKKYNFKVGIETVNCLLDALGRAKLAKEAQTLFEKLGHKFAPNLKTYTILINGWCT